MKNICVFGASNSSIPHIYVETAYELGALLAEEGFGMVFGGGAVGLMGAAAEGVHAGGGTITGVIPKRLNHPGIASELCTELIVTADMHERKALMEKLSSGFVILPGGYGTAEELMEVLTLKQLGYLDAPILIINTNGFYNSLLEQFHRFVSDGFMNKRYLGLYKVVDSPSEAIDCIKNYHADDMPDKIKEALKKSDE